jgi:hypothetical protein
MFRAPGCAGPEPLVDVLGRFSLGARRQPATLPRRSRHYLAPETLFIVSSLFQDIRPALSESACHLHALAQEPCLCGS